MDAGCYALRVRRTRGRSLVVGARGKIRFPKGDYLYFGRAKKGLKARLARHSRGKKPLFWHIDYLLCDRDSKLVSSLVLSTDPEYECRAVALGNALEDCEPVSGFGNSDCKNGCSSHLLCFPRRISKAEFEELIKDRLSRSGGKNE